MIFITPLQCFGSSPHTRGALVGFRRRRAHRRIIPAYAGSTNVGDAPGEGAGDHPRIRGEHFSTTGDPGAPVGSSPHTRGAHEANSLDGQTIGIIPAYAGSTAPRSTKGHLMRDHPRIRGEHRPGLSRGSARRGSSPHTRGARLPSNVLTGCVRIIPAYAGSTRVWRIVCRRCWDHPRIRGEHSLKPGVSNGELGSSPHTRGARPQMFVDTIRGRIIPAYAGSTEGGASADEGARDHPRIRGEHTRCTLKWSPRIGSSPHTRGAHENAIIVDEARWIIPAYAGSTIPRRHHLCRKTDHPRIRGEHGARRQLPAGSHGSSPHTRGARATKGRRRLSRRDHPRIRGEHGDNADYMMKSRGSSPHTRGAPKRAFKNARIVGIIPAYAGSTSLVMRS